MLPYTKKNLGTGSGSNIGRYPEGPSGKNKWDHCSLSLCGCEKDSEIMLFWAQSSTFCISSHETMFRRGAQSKCVLSETAKHKYTEIQWRNPIPFEYIKIGSAGYWCTNCSVIDVSLFTFAGGASSQCGVNGECVFCVFMCAGGKKRQAGVKT